MRKRLREERARLEPDIAPAEKFYEIVTLNTLAGHAYSSEERQEIDRLMKARRRLLKRVGEIDRQLGEIQKEGAAIKKHCAARDTDIQAEAAKWMKRLHDAECLDLGLKFTAARMKAQFASA